MIPSHRRNFIGSDSIRVGRGIALLAGSKITHVTRYAFGLQLGNLSMVLGYILFRFSNRDYFVVNAYILCVLAGVITGLLLQQVLKLFSR